MKIFLALAALSLSSCYFNPVPVSVKGNLVCTYDGARVFAGTVHIDGEGVTNGAATIDIKGTYKLCGGDPKVQCTFTSEGS